MSGVLFRTISRILPSAPLRFAMFDRSLLVKWFGFPATLVHGDALVLDRWHWLRRRLPMTANGERLLDVGCGTGAFTIGAARRGYRALGLSWDERNQRVAAQRSELCRAHAATFEVQDVRILDRRADLQTALRHVSSRADACC